jgi:hypothetical protein
MSSAGRNVVDSGRPLFLLSWAFVRLDESAASIASPAGGFELRVGAELISCGGARHNGGAKNRLLETY